MKAMDGRNLSSRRRLVPSIVLIIAYPVIRIVLWALKNLVGGSKKKVNSGQLPNLAVYQSYQVGDAFMALPAILLLKPHFTVTIICRPDCQGIFQNEGFQVVPHFNPFFAKPSPTTLWHSLQGAWKMRGQIPFLALDFDADPRTAFFLKVAGAGTTYSFARSFDWLFDKTFPLVSKPQHQLDKQLAVAEAFLRHKNLAFPKINGTVNEITKSHVHPLRILLSCWTWKNEKNWPLNYWDQIIISLIDSGCSIEIIVPPEGITVFQSFRLQWQSQVNFLEGDLDKIHLAAKAADGIVCTDNFLGHMGAYSGKPVFWINGSSDPAHVAPRGPRTQIVQVDTMPCRPCSHRCNNPIHKQCLIELVPEKVKMDLAQWLSQFENCRDISNRRSF